MKTLEAIITKFYGEDIFIVDGFDDAVIGIEESTMRLVYSVTKCLEIVEAQGIPEEEALEHFYFNVHATYVGDKTAIFCFDDFTDVL
jgi:hypothetical protein